MIMAGGALCAPGSVLLHDRLMPGLGMVGTQRTHQITSPAVGVDSMSQFIRLERSPLLGPDLHVVRFEIAESDYLRLGTRSGKGAEFNHRVTDFLLPWGAGRVHHWDHIIPLDFPFVDGADTNTIIGQVHEIGTDSLDGQPPNFYMRINRRLLDFRQSNGTYNTTRTVYSMPVVAGQRIRSTLRCRWRDGLHPVPWSEGFLQLWVDGRVVWEDRQTVNCWALANDGRQPFQVMGIYKPNSPAEPSWVGGKAWMHGVAMVTGDEDESDTSLQAFVAEQLRQQQLKRPAWLVT